MPEDDDGTSIGIWIGEGDIQLKDRIDREINWKDSSRSEWWKQAARLRLSVDGKLTELGVDINHPVEKRHHVEHALELKAEADRRELQDSG